MMLAHRQSGNALSQRAHDAAWFMSRNQWQVGNVSQSVLDMDVGAADAARARFDQDFTRPGFGNRNLFDLERFVRGVKNGRFHCCWLARSGRFLLKSQFLQHRCHMRQISFGPFVHVGIAIHVVRQRAVVVDLFERRHDAI